MVCNYTPESSVVKVSSAGGLLPYSFMACTDQLYCVLCWRLRRGREVAVMLEKGREVEVLVRVTVKVRGREEPPLSEGGSHRRVAEKGMRFTTLGFSGTMGTSVC